MGSVGGGPTCSKKSPPDSHEIHEIESLAVDPGQADGVYAGTWHLPWKTTDGGKTWYFFQAEDGIRDVVLTGVQTCALPICSTSWKRVQFGIKDFEQQVNDVTPQPK